MASRSASSSKSSPRKARTTTKGSAGLPVDAFGGATIDPTQNVKDLTDAANLRQDDLRDAAKELYDTKVAHLTYIVELFARFQNEKGILEANRIDSIRQVDREEVAKTAASAQQAIATLANTTTTMAETLRNQQANLASVVETRQSAFAGEVNKRLSALELGSSEGKGRQTVADPMLAELVAEVKRQNAIITSGTGQSQGAKNTVTYIVLAVGLVMSLITIGSVVVAIAFAIRR